MAKLSENLGLGSLTIKSAAWNPMSPKWSKVSGFPFSSLVPIEQQIEGKAFSSLSVPYRGETGLYSDKLYSYALTSTSVLCFPTYR